MINEDVILEIQRKALKNAKLDVDRHWENNFKNVFEYGNNLE